MANLKIDLLILITIYFNSFTCGRQVYDEFNKIGNLPLKDFQQNQIKSSFKFLNLGGISELGNKFPDIEIPRQNDDNTTSEEIEIKSPNYPKPYPRGYKFNYTIIAENVTGIDITIHALDIDPFKDHLLFAHINDESEMEVDLILKGKLSYPLKLRALGNNIEMLIEFHANNSTDEEENKHEGFLLTYELYGEPIIPTVRPPKDIKIPFDELESVSVLLLVLPEKQTNETWNKMRDSLSEATNAYISNFGLDLEPCNSENVTIKSIIQCPTNWPNSKHCIELTFAVTLYELFPNSTNNENETVTDPFLEDVQDRYPAGLHKDQLNMMWRKFGEKSLYTLGVSSYSIPDASPTIIVWVIIGCGVILVAIVLIIVACRVKILRGYWSSVDNEDQKILKRQPEANISMFPSPDQVVPALFPTSVNYPGLMGNLEEDYPNQNHQYSERAVTTTSLVRGNSENFSSINPAFIDDDEHTSIGIKSSTYLRRSNKNNGDLATTLT